MRRGFCRPGKKGKRGEILHSREGRIDENSPMKSSKCSEQTNLCYCTQCEVRMEDHPTMHTLLEGGKERVE